MESLETVKVILDLHEKMIESTRAKMHAFAEAVASTTNAIQLNIRQLENMLEGFKNQNFLLETLLIKQRKLKNRVIKVEKSQEEIKESLKSIKGFFSDKAIWVLIVIFIVSIPAEHSSTILKLLGKI